VARVGAGGVRAWYGAVALAAASLAACGGSATHAGSTPSAGQRALSAATASTSRAAPSPAPKPKPPPPPAFPQLTPSATQTAPTQFVPVVRWRGRTAAWIARSSAGVTLMSFDQRLVALHLHSGTVDAGTLGWRYGPAVGGAELRRLIAAFNGGFRLSTGAGGFMSYGRVGSPLESGRASIVTYSDGSTDIGSWRQEVPAPGKTVVSVRQNLTLLIDHGAPAGSLGCLTCWGATLGGVIDPARSALGITADGRLIWAGAL